MADIFEYIILILFFAFFGYVLYSNQFKKKNKPSKKSEEVPSPEDIKIEPQKIDGLPGNWLSLGENEFGTTIYLGLDTVSRIPSANMNIGMFDRMITNPEAINEEGDKSAIVTRVVDFNNNSFKDTKWDIYKKPFCKGKGEEFKFNLDELEWTPIVQDSWDWLFGHMVKDLGLTVAGKNIGKS